MRWPVERVEVMALRDVAIAGVYATRQALDLGRRPIDVALEAVKGALEDAGLRPSDVDGMAVDWPGPGGARGETASWGRLLDITLAWTGDAFFDTAGVRGVAKAASAIAAGLCEVAVVGGGQWDWRADGGATVGSRSGLEFADCWGAYVTPQFALVAQRHMHQFGTRPEQMAAVAATIRNHGHRNPEAVMYGRGPYTVDDVLASRMIATPFHLLDVCLVAQGGAAVVLTTAARALDLPRPPVLVAGAGMEIHHVPYANPALYREVGRIGEAAARRALGMADVDVHDVDVFCLYDPTSFEVIRQFEILGLCAEGEGGPFVEDGTIALGGRHPTNPDGGCLSYTWNGTQQMTLKVVECVKQLRGEAGGRQVEGAEVALAANGGAGNQHYELAVLVRP